MDFKKMVYQELCECVEECESMEPVAVVEQGLLWPGVSEVRVVMKGGKIYSSIRKDGESVSDWSVVPQEGKTNELH